MASYVTGKSLQVRSFQGRSACVYVRRHQSFDKPLRDVYVRALRELAQAAQLPMQVIRW